MKQVRVEEPDSPDCLELTKLTKEKVSHAASQSADIKTKINEDINDIYVS